MKTKRLDPVKRLETRRAIIAIASTLLEMIYTMLKKDEDFVDQIDALTER